MAKKNAEETEFHAPEEAVPETELPADLEVTVTEYELGDSVKYYVEEQELHGASPLSEELWVPRGGRMDRPEFISAGQLPEVLRGVEALNATSSKKKYRVVGKIDISAVSREIGIADVYNATSVSLGGKKVIQKKQGLLEKLGMKR